MCRLGAFVSLVLVWTALWPATAPARAQAAPTVQSVQFASDSPLALYPATWTVSMTVAGNVYASDSFTLTGPALSTGFQWSTQASQYSATVQGGSQTVAEAVYFPQGGPYEDNTVTLSIGGGSAPVAVAGDTITLTVQGAHNPTAGSYPASDFSVQLDSQSPVSPTQGLSFANASTTLSASADNLAEGGDAAWSFAFANPAALAAGSGAITLTGPVTWPTAAADYVIQDTTAGGPPAAPLAVSAVPSPVLGINVQVSSVQLTVPATIAAGDTVSLRVAHVTNPVAGQLQADGTLFPGTMLIGVGGTAPPVDVSFSGAFVASQPGVTASVSSGVSGAVGVTWSVGFPAEAVLGPGDSITLSETQGGAAFASDPADYSISVNGGNPVQPASAVAAALQGGGAEVVLGLPAGASIPELAQVSVQARAVSNPTASGTAQVSVATDRTPSGAAATPPSFAPVSSSAGSGTISGVQRPRSAQLDPVGTAVALPPGPLPPEAPNTPAALAFGTVCQNSTCTGNLVLQAQPTQVTVGSQTEYVFLDPSHTVDVPVYNVSTNGITATSVCANETTVQNGNTTLTQLACVSSLAPQAEADLVFTMPGLSATITFTAQANGIANPNGTVTGTDFPGQPNPGTVTIVQSPTALEELNVLPFKILYQPPGDQSVASFLLSQGTSDETDYSFTSSNTNSQMSSTDIGLSVDTSIDAGGFKADLSDNADWDQTDTSTVSTSATTGSGVSYTTTVSQQWQAGADPNLDSPGTQPWTGDQFVLLVHPQFAIWDNLTCVNGTPLPTGGCQGGTSTAAGSQVAYALTGANPSYLVVTAGQLAACAQGSPLQPPGTFVPAVVLQPSECASLLQLDPFAAAGSQAVDPQAALGNLVTQVESYSAGTAPGGTQGAHSVTLDQQQATTSSTSTDTSFSSEVDSVFTNTASLQAGYSGGLGSVATASVTGGFSFTASMGVDVTQSVDVQQSQTQTSTVEQAASATLGDSATALSTTIYLDSRWDTLMFQVAAPAVSSVAPSSGVAGQQVVVQGSGFDTGPVGAEFCPTSGGGGCTPSVASLSQSNPAGSAVTTVPTGLAPGTYVVRLIGSGGTSTAACQSGQSCDEFTVVPSISTSGASVSTVSPSSGPNGGGSVVTLVGSGLTGATAVWFGVADPTQDPGDLQQFQASGASGPPPVAPAPAFRVVDDSHIVACLPAVSATGTLWVSVLGPGGWSPVGPGDGFNYTAGAAAGGCDQETLAGPPAVSSLSPATGPAVGGNLVTINGSGFQPLEVTAPCSAAGCPVGGTVTLLEPPTVDFCALSGSPCVPATDVTLVSSSEITAQAPPGSGTVDVRVGSGAGFSSAVPADQYTYALSAPCTASCSGPGSLALTVAPPAVAAGPGTADVFATVLDGQGQPVANAPVVFRAAGGQVGTSGTVYTNAAGLAANTVSAAAPGSLTLDVVVPAQGSQVELENQVQAQFAHLPVVTGLSVTTGPTGGGNAVTVEGLGFQGATDIYFGSVAVGVTSTQVSPDGTAITVSAPAGSGSVDVRVANAAAISGAVPADRYSYTAVSALAPQVTSVTPSAGQAGGGFVVDIRGSGFTGASQVLFGTTAASAFQVVSDGEIQATAPPGSGTVDVRVTTSNGTSPVTPGDAFAYATPVQPVSRVLSGGWNTLSEPFPLATSASALGQVLSDGGSSVVVALTYDCTTSQQVASGNCWQQVTGPLPGPMQGLFVELRGGTGPVTATLTPASGVNPPPQYALQQGWNLVGPSSLGASESDQTFLSGVTPSTVPMLVDPNGSPVAITDPAADTGHAVKNGYAYWVYAEAPGSTLVGQVPTGSTNP